MGDVGGNGGNFMWVHKNCGASLRAQTTIKYDAEHSEALLLHITYNGVD